jgi:hypothetical protein
MRERALIVRAGLLRWHALVARSPDRATIRDLRQMAASLAAGLKSVV